MMKILLSVVGILFLIALAFYLYAEQHKKPVETVGKNSDSDLYDLWYNYPVINNTVTHDTNTSPSDNGGGYNNSIPFVAGT